VDGRTGHDKMPFNDSPQFRLAMGLRLRLAIQNKSATAC
jgi:hypothetical protein